MLFKDRDLLIARFALMLVLLGGMFGARPARASGDVVIPRLTISTPSYPVGMNSGESKLVPYSLTELSNLSGEITSRTYRFYTQYDVPLSDPMGPYPTSISINPLQTKDWNELVYLPKSVVDKARSMEEYAIVVKTTFKGKSSAGMEFGAQASLLLLLPPEVFGKKAPADGDVIQPINQALQWNSGIGAVDYEYCFDTIDNNSCDTGWTGTYDTNALLQDLPPNATFYWQVRANNTAGTTYADKGSWWSFATTTCDNVTAIVTNTNDAGAGSLRQAIVDICPGGTIRFDNSLNGQTITLVSTLVINKDLTIDGSALTSMISISGNSSVTVFTVQAGSTITLESLTIKNGHSDELGGGIFNSGTLTLINSRLSQNSAVYGGAIFNEPTGTLNIASSIISGSSAGTGGAVLNRGILNIVNTTLSENRATYGAGIYNVEKLELIDSTLSWNYARSLGSGIFNEDRVDVFNSTFYHNLADYSGGGIANSRNGTLSIQNSTFVDNTTSEGGGIYNEGTLTVTNSTFSGNAGGPGGGIYNQGKLNYANNIIANSISYGDCYSGSSGVLGSNINNLVETNATSPNHCGTPLISSDPLLDILANDGGFTQTMALLPGSPAIDSGDDATCAATDQRGVTRPRGAHCDIGAYEYDGIVVPPSSTPTQTPTFTPTSTHTATPTLTPTPTWSYNPLYLSLTGNQSIGGVASADEDILRFDGQTWSLVFDGSDVGVGSSDLFGFSLLDSDSILMSFGSALTVNGLAITPQDVVRFDATSLGSITTGTFSMYLDGSDVGLDTTAEKIDSVSLLPDGRVLISTTGNPAVVGVIGGKDEDVLAFTPTSLRDVTSGSWAMYFDGSDVGLAETSGEDVDALDVTGGKVYLSTADSFSVTGAAGADEDVFICTPTSLGDVTACSYSSSLYFDGSTWGLSANDVDAFHFLTIGPVPTATYTNTPSITPSPTFTTTASPTPTRTPTSSNTPTPGSQLLPDLTIIEMRNELQNTSCFTPGDPFGVRVWIRNIGQAAAGSFVVNVNGAEQTVNGLGIGETKAVFFPGSGNPVTATVDSTGTVAESNETNNTRSEMLPIPTAPLPCATPTFTATPAATFTPTITNTPNASDLIFANDFESGNHLAWSSSSTDLGDLRVSNASALLGSQGLQAVIDDATPLYLTDDRPTAEPRYRVRFYFDPNSIAMASGEAHYIFKGFSGTSTEVLRVEFRFFSGAYQLRAAVLNDGTTWTNTNWFTISDAPHSIELDWRAATAAGANNGGLTLWIDGLQQADLLGVDNDTRRIDRARLGALSGIDTGTRGTYYFDAFESRRQTFIGP